MELFMTPTTSISSNLPIYYGTYPEGYTYKFTQGKTDILPQGEAIVVVASENNKKGIAFRLSNGNYCEKVITKVPNEESENYVQLQLENAPFPMYMKKGD